MTPVKKTHRLYIYAAVALGALVVTFVLLLVAKSMPARELPPLYIGGVIINLSIIQIASSVVTLVGLILTALHLGDYEGISSKPPRIVYRVGILFSIAWAFLFFLASFFTSHSYSVLGTDRETGCVVIFSESQTVMNLHSGALYVAGESGGLGVDTRYHWSGGESSLPEVGTLNWENGVGFIEPWDVLEPTPDQPARLTCQD